MDQLTAHRRALDAYAAVLAGVRDDQLDAPSPCEDWSAGDVIDHILGGCQRVQLLAGREPVALPDDADRSTAYATASAAAHAVFAAPDGMTTEFELPFGKVPGSFFIALRTVDHLVHAWDLATATGQPRDLDPELAVETLAAAKERMNPALRGEGRPFGDEQACPSGASDADRLAAFLGRAVS